MARLHPVSPVPKAQTSAASGAYLGWRTNANSWGGTYMAQFAWDHCINTRLWLVLSLVKLDDGASIPKIASTPYKRSLSCGEQESEKWRVVHYSVNQKDYLIPGLERIQVELAISFRLMDGGLERPSGYREPVAAGGCCRGQ